MPPKSRARPKGPRALIAEIKPLIPAVVAPVVEPVLKRLDRHEELLVAVQSALDVQFQRIAAMQAQLDILIAAQRRADK